MEENQKINLPFNAMKVKKTILSIKFRTNFTVNWLSDQRLRRAESFVKENSFQSFQYISHMAKLLSVHFAGKSLNREKDKVWRRIKFSGHEIQ